ncbi:MAG: hypothetical protein AAF673_05110 [Pseudomonadota bacterium]
MIISGKLPLIFNEAGLVFENGISESIDCLIKDFEKEIEAKEKIEWQTKKSRKGLAPGISELLLFVCTFSSGIATGIIANYITKYLESKFSRKKKEIATENDKIIIVLEEAKIIIEIKEEN